MKFGIGTSSFVKNYGLTKINCCRKDLKKILSNYNSKIDLVDTAPSYGDSEYFIGKYSGKNYKIVTKINKIKKSKINFLINSINNELKLSLKKLKRKKIYCLMFHFENDVKYFKNKIFLNNIINIKKKFCKKIGLSCYNISKLPKYFKNFKFDIVQVPINPFALTKENYSIIKTLKKKYNCEFHARSIFLQGLALKKKLNKKNFIELELKKKYINLYCKENNLTEHEFYISYVKSLKLFDYSIIGITNINEYKMLKNIELKKINQNLYFKFNLKNRKNIDPRYWKY